MALLGRLRLALAPSWSVRRGMGRWHGPMIPPSSSQPSLSPTTTTTTTITIPLTLTRSYSKSKDRKGRDKASRAHVTREELEEVVDVEKMVSHFASLVENLKQDYIKNLTLRTAAGSLESLPVLLEGDEYPLNEVAQVSRRSPQVVVVNAAAFPQALPGIVAAIRGAGMNLNPQQEGTTVIVPIPKVTKEHRENLAKGAKAMFTRCKDKLREAQNEYMRKAKTKEGKLSEDLIFNAQLRIRELAEEHMHQAEEMMHAKQRELLRTG